MHISTTYQVCEALDWIPFVSTVAQIVHAIARARFKDSLTSSYGSYLKQHTVTARCLIACPFINLFYKFISLKPANPVKNAKTHSYEIRTKKCDSRRLVIEAGQALMIPISGKKLELFTSHEKTIQDHYKAFKESKQKAATPKSINESSQALAHLKDMYRNLGAADKQGASSLLERIKQAEEQVRAMNFHSDTATSADTSAITSFFEKPLEDVFIDKETGKKYTQPNYSQLFTYCSPLVLKGKFQGMSCGKHQKKPDGICDIFVLKKTNRQIALESPSTRIWDAIFPKSALIKASELSELTALIKGQEALANEVITHLESSEVSSWGYDYFHLATGQALCQLGFDPEEAKRYFVLFGYYKEQEQEGASTKAIV